MAEHLVEAGLHARADRTLQARRLLVRFGPAQADDRREQPLQERMPAEDSVGRCPAGLRQDQVTAAGLGHEPVGDEAPEHLGARLGAHAHPAGDLSHADVRAVSSHAPQGEQVLLGRRGRIVARRSRLATRRRSRLATRP